MKKLLPLLLLPLAAGCTTQGIGANDHWSGWSVGNSMGRHLLNYDQERDGDYVEFQARQKKAFNLTLRRHLMNSNPENPFQPEQRSFYRPRAPHSPLPDVVSYLQDPISSVFGTFTPTGEAEFSEGLRVTGDELFDTTCCCTKSASYLRSSLGLTATAAPDG